LFDTTQKARVMFEAVLEPVLFRLEADQHACGLAMARDNDLLRLIFLGSCLRCASSAVRTVARAFAVSLLRSSTASAVRTISKGILARFVRSVKRGEQSASSEHWRAFG
jgi:hypothetical protein